MAEKKTLVLVLATAGLVAVGGAVLVLGFNKPGKEPVTTGEIMQPEKPKLQVIDEKAGTGREAKSGDMVSVNYVGRLSDGTEFDSSYRRNQPFSFTLGAGQVIAGWDQGLSGMKVGGKRKLIIPPDLAYGSRAIGSIPANSTLIFEVELLDVK